MPSGAEIPRSRSRPRSGPPLPLSAGPRAAAPSRLRCWPSAATASIPVPRYQDFTRDVDRLTRFIGSLQPGGGTPMADALLFANRYLENNGSDGASDRMIMLLADGQNDCGDVGQAMATLQSSGIIFRHETVGFGITPSSAAAQDLRQIATQTGGTYHHAADASQLSDVFMEFVDTLSLIDMLGRFGTSAQGARASPGSPARAVSAPRQGGASQASGKPAGKGGLSSLIGAIKAKPPAGGGTTVGFLNTRCAPSVGLVGPRLESRPGLGMVDRLSDPGGRGSASALGVRRPLPRGDEIQRRMRRVRCGPDNGQHGLRLGERLPERLGSARPGSVRVPTERRDVVPRAFLGLHAPVTGEKR